MSVCFDMLRGSYIFQCGIYRKELRDVKGHSFGFSGGNFNPNLENVHEFVDVVAQKDNIISI